MSHVCCVRHDTPEARSPLAGASLLAIVNSLHQESKSAYVTVSRIADEANFWGSLLIVYGALHAYDSYMS